MIVKYENEIDRTTVNETDGMYEEPCPKKERSRRTEFLTEEELLMLAQQGNGMAMEQLMRNYVYLVERKGNRYYLPYGEREDLLQEGMIGLYLAVKDYQRENGMTFSSFAGMCIGRKMMDAVRKAMTGNRKLVTHTLSLEELREKEDGCGKLPVTREQLRQNPEWTLLRKEYYQELRGYMGTHLSQLERMILYWTILGYSFCETAERVAHSQKAVDNGLQRVREKMRRSPFFHG